MARKTPKGWTRPAFARYILECAIRDREALLYAYEGDLTVDIVRQTIEEVRAMRERLRAMNTPEKNSPDDANP